MTKREAHNVACRKWYQANKAKADATIAKWQRNNPEKLREAAARYRQVHKDRADACTSRWKAANPGYTSWKCMKERCYDSEHPGYKRYGARGISVCARWLESYVNFRDDMGLRPEGYTLDRIDSNGNYEPHNCRWADRKTQANNRRPRV